MGAHLGQGCQALIRDGGHDLAFGNAVTAADFGVISEPGNLSERINCAPTTEITTPVKPLSLTNKLLPKPTQVIFIPSGKFDMNSDKSFISAGMKKYSALPPVFQDV